MILQALHEIQHRHGYLPADELRALAERSRVPLYRVHEVASYYPHYRLQPPPAVDVRVCRDLACHLRGGPGLAACLGSTAQEFPAGTVVVSGVSCLGQCDRAPAYTINDHIHHGLSETDAQSLLRNAALGSVPMPRALEREPVRWQIDAYASEPPFDLVRRFVRRPDSESVLRELEAAGLRGMGGAGFPTHRKWAAVRTAVADAKYVIANADESEPGAFKDRELLARVPHLLIEGMVLAGLVTGATRGIVYVRHEYQDEIRILRKALEAAWAQGIGGPGPDSKILNSEYRFRLELMISPGGYIQGEETALLEALEDRRGEPRNKPPFPTTVGLFGKPTVINNVETLCWVPAILLRGGDWYRTQGINGATGLRFVSVSGDVRRPGVYEVPLGQTVRQLIHDTAGGMREGRRLLAIAPSGPSGGFLPATIPADRLPVRFANERLQPGAKHFDILDLPLDFATLASLDSMLGAAFIVVGEGADLLDLARNGTRFFRNESCGKCVPCRLGTQQLVTLLEERQGQPLPASHLPIIQDVADAMTATSICGLGQVAAKPLTSVLKYFPETIDHNH